MKRSADFPDFQGWEEGYGAFTCCRIIGYRQARTASLRQRENYPLYH
ncbi:MAG: hypothetical protein LBJ60_04030 [Tannerellaceae bacterium]|nr:hypothetical protein [Tannerellaceae bacterium]